MATYTNTGDLVNLYEYYTYTDNSNTYYVWYNSNSSYTTYYTPVWGSEDVKWLQVNVPIKQKKRKLALPAWF